MFNDELNGRIPIRMHYYNKTEVKVYYANKGEGILKHIHNNDHLTMCCVGKILVRLEDREFILTKSDNPFILPKDIFHEIEAIEDGTIFMNMMPQEYADKTVVVESQVQQGFNC
jgi:quercetin dioxygenase-like cupin family protein